MLTQWDRLFPDFMAWSKIRLNNNNKPLMINEAGCDSRTNNNDDYDSMNSINDGVNIWSSLPEDLIARIFSCLPLTSILRLRCVCKRWNSLVQSKRFHIALAKVSSPRPPWFILCTMGRASCSYDPTMKKWHIIVRPLNNGRSILSPCTSILAVSGSILCLGNQVSECKVLSLCNPITKSQRNLPRMLQVSLIHKVTMITYPSNKNSYKIMVSGESGFPTMRSVPYTYELLTEVYDSCTNSWKMCGRPLPEAKFGSDPGVWCNDHLYYCITELPYGVVVFDLKTESWAELKVQMPSSLSSPSLVACCGRLLMIGKLSNMDQVTPTVPDQNASNIPRIIIWELDIPHKEWVEIVAVPTAICSGFSVPLEFYAPFVCSGLGNHIYITTHRNPQVLVHDLFKNTWEWLPSDPLFPRRRDFHLLGFALEPSLDSSP